MATNAQLKTQLITAIAERRSQITSILQEISALRAQLAPLMNFQVGDIVADRQDVVYQLTRAPFNDNGLQHFEAFEGRKQLKSGKWHSIPQYIGYGENALKLIERPEGNGNGTT